MNGSTGTGGRAWLADLYQSTGSVLAVKSFTGKELTRYGFTCTRVGKNRAESAWSVSKAESAG